MDFNIDMKSLQNLLETDKNESSDDDEQVFYATLILNFTISNTPI